MMCVCQVFPTISDLDELKVIRIAIYLKARHTPPTTFPTCCHRTYLPCTGRRSKALPQAHQSSGI